VNDLYRQYTLVLLIALIPGFALGQIGTACECSFDIKQRRIEILAESGATGAPTEPAAEYETVEDSEPTDDTKALEPAE
jgi:hypothetical protein